MNQVECGLAPFEIVCEGFGVRKIGLPNLHSGIFGPFAALRASPASGRDNEWSNQNRADAERAVRQCSRWLRQSRHVADWSFQTSLDPTFSTSSGSGLPRLLQPADIETPALGLHRRVDCMWHRPSGAIAKESRGIPGLGRPPAHTCNPARAQ